MSKHLKHAAILTVIVSVLLIIMPAAANSACAPQFDVMLNLCSCSNIDPSMYFNTNKAGCTLAACESHFGDCTSNAAPTATGVSITGTAAVGQILTGTYTYADDENDAEGTSTFKWYSGTDAACAEKTEVGTAVTYTVADADKDKYLCFEVTPVATTGTTPGTAVMSAGVKVTAAATAPGYGSAPAPGSTVNVGTAAVGSPASTTLAVSETGNAELQVAGHALSGANPGDFSVTPATLTLADGGAAQNLTVQCTPAAAGFRTATLTVNHNASGSPATYTLNCTGTTAATPGYGSAPAPGSIIDVGTAAVGSPVSTTLAVSETGNAELQVAGHALSGANPGDFSVTPATLTLADGGAAQNLTVQCTPAAAGLRTATLTVNHNAPGSPATYTLTCTGKLPGDVDGNGKVEFADAVLAFKIAAGVTLPGTQTINLNADVNGDGKIGIPEAISVLMTLAKPS